MTGCDPIIDAGPRSVDELTVNWHILEQCNYDCYFCYAKYGQPSGFRTDFPSVLRELSSLAGRSIKLANGSICARSIRINFAGGEPLLVRTLGDAIEMAHSLNLRPSIITNGSLVTDDFILRYGGMLSVFGISIDSFDPEVNERIGRSDSRGAQIGLDRAQEIFSAFREISPSTTLKINTVVCQENADKDLSEALIRLRPDRWKALRVIPIHGGKDRGITDEQFNAFVKRHEHVAGHVVPEDNGEMHRSYLMLDPQGCFYQREGSDYLRTGAVASIGALEALKAVEFDVDTFLSRY